MHAALLLATVAATTRGRERAVAALAPMFAPRFNAVALLGPGETALSAAFRWLLDERADHGQGAVFRTLFVAMLLPIAAGAVDWSGATVACEVATRDGRGRIDLLLTARNGACVAIENKPWAGWQETQLERYLDDRLAAGGPVWLHALIGGIDVEAELDRQWCKASALPRPAAVSGSGYGTVVEWLDACACAARPDRVRHFLFDLAGYCRRSVLQEPAMNDEGATAAMILAGGRETLMAAQEVQAALPEVYRLLSEQVAAAVGGTTTMVGSHRVVRFVHGDVPLAAALFGQARPWIGVTDADAAPALNASLPWGPAERLWPRWIHVDRIEKGAARALVEAVAAFDPRTVAEQLPAFAGTMFA